MTHSTKEDRDLIVAGLSSLAQQRGVTRLCFERTTPEQLKATILGYEGRRMSNRRFCQALRSMTYNPEHRQLGVHYARPSGGDPFSRRVYRVSYRVL